MNHLSSLVNLHTPWKIPVNPIFKVKQSRSRFPSLIQTVLLMTVGALLLYQHMMNPDSLYNTYSDWSRPFWRMRVTLPLVLAANITAHVAVLLVQHESELITMLRLTSMSRSKMKSGLLLTVLYRTRLLNAFAAAWAVAAATRSVTHFASPWQSVIEARGMRLMTWRIFLYNAIIPPAQFRILANTTPINQRSLLLFSRYGSIPETLSILMRVGLLALFVALGFYIGLKAMRPAFALFATLFATLGIELLWFSLIRWPMLLYLRNYQFSLWVQDTSFDIWALYYSLLVILPFGLAAWLYHRVRFA